MNRSEVAALFAPLTLVRAGERWGGPCALFAVGLRDPLGGAMFETLKSIGCVPRPLRRLAIIDRAPVVACAAPLDDLLGALHGLADAERWAASRGDPPLTPDAGKLYSALADAARTGDVAVVFAAEGLCAVLPLDEAAPHVCTNR